MRHLVFLSFFLILPFIYSFSQDDKTLMTIGGQSVSLQEFERIYNKNNSAGVFEKQPVEEYLELFINFKLKVIEAENLGMDTLSSFVNELNGYRDQLAKPYLSDSASLEELLKQQYERMKNELLVSHILLQLDPKASPEDTLVVYNRLMEIRNRIVKGEKFEDVAKAVSEDPSVSSNGGDIGWVSAFRTVWEFEDAVYKTKVNEISMPIRTQFGYHLAKVVDKRPSPGTVHVAHIFVRAPEDISPEMKEEAVLKIYSVYDSLMKGSDFAQLANNNSDDRASASEGGELQWFGSGQMIPEFEKAAFSLTRIGEFSKPVQSFYGWHILKLLGKNEIQSYEELRPDLLSKLTDTPVSVVKQRKYIESLKAQYTYSFNKANYAKLETLIDTSIFGGNWSDSLLRSKKDVLFTIGNKNFSIANFASYLNANQRKTEPYSVSVFLHENFVTFSDNAVMDYEKDQLSVKYPEFKHILQEYHDGILLFDLTDKMVWSKAVQDTIGLQSFYNKNKSNYMWEDRVEAMIFTSDSIELLNKARELASKYGKKKKFTADFVLEKVCLGDSTKNCIDISSGYYEKGENEKIDNTQWIPGVSGINEELGLSSFILVRKTIKPTIKKLDEARGLITSDYQNELEKEWIAGLRAKYPVEVNSELLKTIQ